MLRTFGFIGAFALALLVAPPSARADLIFDTNSVVTATDWNYWPWGDSRNTRYQLWYASSALSGYTGILKSITHFAHEWDSDNLGTSSYTMEIYASTTSVGSGSLSADTPESNHGADKTLIFSGTVTSAATFLLDVDDVFDYDGSGHLLLDYQFSSFSGVGDFYDGPTFEAMPTNASFYRVTNHSSEGNVVFAWGAIRSELVFGPSGVIPEPSSFALLGLGMIGMVAGAIRRQRQA